MDFGSLLLKLVEIEKSIGTEAPIITRRRIMDAQVSLLQLQSEVLKTQKKGVESDVIRRSPLIRLFPTKGD